MRIECFCRSKFLTGVEGDIDHLFFDEVKFNESSITIFYHGWPLCTLSYGAMDKFLTAWNDYLNTIYGEAV